MERTSSTWYRMYCCWGGLQLFYDFCGWRGGCQGRAWSKEKVTAEEFLRRAKMSERRLVCASEKAILTKQKCGTMDDMEYFFTCVVREGDE